MICLENTGRKRAWMVRQKDELIRNLWVYRHPYKVQDDDLALVLDDELALALVLDDDLARVLALVQEASHQREGIERIPVK